jgi:hypothetical protein
MAEHAGPGLLKRSPMRQKRLIGRNRNILICAFLLQYVAEHGRGWPGVSMPKEVHDIVQVARPGSFAESAHLFGESLLISIAIDPEALLR